MKPRSIDKNYNAIEKCLQILSMYSLDKTQFSIKEICTQLNFNVSTAYRILCTLEEYGYVSRLKNKDYVIGTQALYLSAIYTQSNHLEQIRPIVDRIRDISGETSSFFVEEDDNRICLYRAHSRDEIFLSSSACSSASCLAFSISSSLSPLDPSMEIFCSLLFFLSVAVTCRMPFTSMSKVTSI